MTSSSRDAQSQASSLKFPKPNPEVLGQIRKTLGALAAKAAFQIGTHYLANRLNGPKIVVMPNMASTVGASAFPDIPDVQQPIFTPKPLPSTQLNQAAHNTLQAIQASYQQRLQQTLDRQHQRVQHQAALPSSIPQQNPLPEFQPAPTFASIEPDHPTMNLEAAIRYQQLINPYNGANTPFLPDTQIAQDYRQFAQRPYRSLKIYSNCKRKCSCNSN